MATPDHKGQSLREATPADEPRLVSAEQPLVVPTPSRKERTSTRLSVMLVSSSGGHLLQLYRLRPWWAKHDRAWVTFKMPDSLSLLAGENVSWAHHPTTRNIPN